MAITRNLVVMLKDDIAKPKEKMFIYRDDVGVEMVIELKDFDYSIDMVGNRNNIQKAYALFRTPTKKTYQYTDIKISNGKLVFTFSQDVISVMQEIGEYELQFQLYDKEDNRLTIPSYNFYVKEPLTVEGEHVGTAVVDESVIVDRGEEQDYIFVITDGYIKTKWRTGDLITKERLNKVENALSVITDAVNSKVGISQLHNHGNKEILDTISANKINEWDNKSNFNGDYNNLTNKPTIPTKVSDLQNDRGYLTEHQDISGKVDKVDGKSLISDDEIERLSTLKNYDDTDIKNSLNSKANKTELHSHSNKNVLDGISSTKVTEWDNKSTFSGNYNDLTNKPTIPTLNGYATEQYVDEEIKKIDVTEQLTDYAKKSELHSHSNKSVLDGITSNKITEWDNKSAFSGNYNDLTNKPTIPTKVSELTNDEGYLTSIPSEYVTDSELNSKGYLTEHQDISGKVDKVDGHSLVSDTEISRLATLENYDDTEIRELVDEINSSLDDITTNHLNLNIKDFGATGEESQDCTDIFITMLNSIKTNSATIKLPYGIYNITREIELPLKTINFIGEGVEGTIIKNSSSNTIRSFFFKEANNNKRYNTFKDIQFNCNFKVQRAIYFERGNGTKISHCRFINHLESGIYFKAIENMSGAVIYESEIIGNYFRGVEGNVSGDTATQIAPPYNIYFGRGATDSIIKDNISINAKVHIFLNGGNNMVRDNHCFDYPLPAYNSVAHIELNGTSSILGNYFDNPTCGIKVTGERFLISNNNFFWGNDYTTDVSNFKGISLELTSSRKRGVVITNNFFNPIGATIGYDIKVKDGLELELPMIMNNRSMNIANVYTSLLQYKDGDTKSVQVNGTFIPKGNILPPSDSSYLVGNSTQPFQQITTKYSPKCDMSNYDLSNSGFPTAITTGQQELMTLIKNLGDRLKILENK